MTIADQIAEILADYPNGLKASEIAKKIGCTRKNVNSYLYAHKDRYEQHDGYVWTAKSVQKKSTASSFTQQKQQTNPNNVSVQQKIIQNIPEKSVKPAILSIKKRMDKSCDDLLAYLDKDTDVYYRTWKLQIFDGSFAYGVEWSVDKGVTWHSCSKSFSSEWEAERYLMDCVRCRTRGHFY